jgi:hypothetical protein
MNQKPLLTARNLAELENMIKAFYNTNEVRIESLDIVNSSIYVRGVQMKQLWISRVKGEFRLYEEQGGKR